MLRIASFDMGVRNFAFTVLDCPPLALQRILPKTQRVSRTVLSTQWEQETQIVHWSIVDIVLESQRLVTNPAHSATPSDMTNVQWHRALGSHLDSYADLWSSCHVFLIERQMAFGNARNPTAVLLSHHVLAHMSTRYGATALIHEYAATNKTRIFTDIPMTKPQRKRWTVERIDAWLHTFHPDWAIRWDAIGKQDDIADTIMQAWAYWIRASETHHSALNTRSTTQ